MKTYFYTAVISVMVMVLLMLMLVGCSDDDNPVNSNSVFTMTKFPMAVGNKWVYSVNDTIQGTIDTISVLAFDTTTLFNGEFANGSIIEMLGCKFEVANVIGRNPNSSMKL